MKSVYTAKAPNLSFLRATPKKTYNYSFIINSKGMFNWEANNYLMEFGGGVSIYGIKPTHGTIDSHAYSIGLFHEFLESIDIHVYDTDDNCIFDYVIFLKQRSIFDETIKKHVRKTLDYLMFIQTNNSNLLLITSNINANKKYNTHIDYRYYKHNGFSKKYIHHDALTSLTVLHTEIEYIRDDEFILWLDSIKNTSLHPEPDEFIISRWNAISYLLDGTGSRISELADITRSMIKDAYEPFTDMDDKVILKGVPVKKGKYKGDKRNIPIYNGTLQLVMDYISLIEELWPNMEHDALFVNAENGAKLKNSYLKNYTLNVIKNCKFSKQLRHLNNHSFRHRYITINVAHELHRLKEQGGFINILPVAATAVRKLTLHASNDSLSRYIHLAQEYNEKKYLSNEKINAPLKNTIIKMKNIMASYERNEINEHKVIDSIALYLGEI